MTKTLNMGAKFAKVNETEDGGREVWGFATLERVDKSGEIADFDGTVKAFEKWASETEKRTGGKSKGNVRLMHQPIVAGKAIHWEPSESNVDGETYKGIWVGAYVPPTKPDVIKDIDEGILSGFSIGGSYEKRWYDESAKAFRFIPELAEFSLVDNPCVPGADITQVIQKAVPSVAYDVEELAKAVVDDGSLEAQQSRISSAVADRFRGPSQWWDGYVVRTFADKVIIFDFSQDKYFEVPFEDKGDEFVFGQPTEVVEIRSYVPADALKSMHDTELAKRSERQKESEQSVNVDFVKAMQTAGIITEEQADAMLKALSLTKAQDTPPVPVNAPTVDGDGDDDENKEFPNPPSADEKVNIPATEKDVKDAEEEVGVAEKAVNAQDDSEQSNVDDEDEDDMEKVISILSRIPRKLEKAGKSISAANAEHLHKAIGHVTAALSSNHGYTCGDAGQGNTGEEAPEVTAKALVGEMQKSVNAEMASFKEANKGEMEAMHKSLLESFTKAHTELFAKAMEPITSRLETMEKMVKEIHETPMPGGPALNGGSPDVAKMLSKGVFNNNVDMATLENEALANVLKTTNDPQLRDRLGQEIALRQAKTIIR